MTTINYTEYIRSEAWREKANAAKWLANYRCSVCGSTQDIEAHHKTYARLGHELPEDIVVLCAQRHALYHDKLAAQRELPVAARRSLVVTIATRSHANYLKLEAVYALLINRPGRDSFVTRMPIDGELRELTYPEDTTTITPDLVAAISAIVGADNVEVREENISPEIITEVQYG